MTLNALQLDELCMIAQAAGREIMAVYATEFASSSKDDASPLTQADLRADAAIRQGLELAFPGTFIWSEESLSAGSAKPESFFLVDPLDGTKEFLKRNGEFTVNIAWVHQGEAAAGVVFAPALGELFYAARGLGAYKRTAAGGQVKLRSAKQKPPAEKLRVIGSRSHGSAEQDAWLAQLSRPHEFIAAGSSLKFCRLAEGVADIYPRLAPTSQWDTAAAQAVLEEAGGAVLDLNRQPLRYGLDRPVLNPHFVAVADPSLKFW